MNKRGLSYKRVKWVFFALLLIIAIAFTITSINTDNLPKTGAGKLAYSISGLIKDTTNSISNKLFGVSVLEGVRKITGSKGEWGGFPDFCLMFLLGLTAGFFAKIGVALAKGFWYLYWVVGYRMMKKAKFGFKTIGKGMYLDFMTDWAKIIVFAVIFAIIMQITFINQVIKIMLFWHLTPFWLKPIILGIIFYYIPALVEHIWKAKTEYKAKENLIKRRAGIQILENLGKG